MTTLEQQVSEELRPEVHRLRVSNRWLIVSVVVLALALVVLAVWTLTSDSTGDAMTVNQAGVIYDEYEASIVAGDTQRWMELWSDDPVQLVPDAPPNIGREAIATSLEAEFAVIDWTEFDISTEEVQTAGDWAYAWGTFMLSGEVRDDGTPIFYDGKYLTIFERQTDDSWNIHRDIFNSNLPPA